MGLSNAGKTTMIQVLMERYDPEAPIKPTFGVDRQRYWLDDHELVVWDFGGQESYRNQYLQAPDKYFKHVATAFYVVDVQDPARLISNISYFKLVVEHLLQFSPGARIVLVFHKMDPEFDPAARKINVREQFLANIAEFATTHGLDLPRFDTTIYDRDSIVTAFRA